MWLSAISHSSLSQEQHEPRPIELRSNEVVHGVTGLIGNTPLVRIDSLSNALGVEILGKAEFLNPGGSVKDRVALRIIEDAERQGLLHPHTGSRIFEGTVGSTGIPIATIAKARQVTLVLNRKIWRQTNSHVDAFISGAGTGGTIAGTGRFLKSMDEEVQVVLADPEGSGLYNKVKHGVMYDRREAEGTKRRHQVDTVVEGIGINRMTNNIDLAIPITDDVFRACNLVACIKSVKKRGCGTSKHLSRSYVILASDITPRFSNVISLAQRKAT
ncbi:tryptophan synthase beta subunit-like PLP-dependent enzyme [Suillus spraguei]|nr:tryptophan synthase beta subunit-like PLP-dependent enzyme [Suillus spraguei]